MHKRRVTSMMFNDHKKKFEKNPNFCFVLLEMWRTRQFIIQNLINKVNPNLVLIEHLFNLPFIMSMKYKWAFIVTTNPLKIANHIDYPPVGSGTCEDFKWFTDTFRELSANFRQKLDEWYKEFGLERKATLCHIQPSPYFNVCLYPRPLNYFNAETGDIDGNWLQLSSTIVKDEVNKFIQDQGWICEKIHDKEEFLTEEFLKKPGKLILFSLGTFVSENIEVFEKIMPVLANCSQHKFIVSKGIKGDEYKLPANCVGANNFDQLELLPLVDVFVTHG